MHLDYENLEKVCQLYSDNLKNLSFEEKRFTLEALQIKVLIDNEKVKVEGAIPYRMINRAWY